jgi:hypothetical protein
MVMTLFSGVAALLWFSPPCRALAAHGWPHLPPRSCATSPSGNVCKSPGSCVRTYSNE